MSVEKRQQKDIVVKDRDTVLALENELRNHDQVDLEPVHHFVKGLYARELFIPQGVLLTGKIHKTQHLCVLSQGKIAVSGVGVKTILEAPAVYVSEPGAKRAIFAIEDSVFMNFHPTDKTDLAEIEADVIAKNFEEFDNEVT